MVERFPERGGVSGLDSDDGKDGHHMDVEGREHDHHFGIGAHDAVAKEPVGLEAFDHEADHHAAAGEVHGLVDHFGADVTHFADALSHLPTPEHGAVPEHDFGTHHDLGDGFHGLHESIHDAAEHLTFHAEGAHGLGELGHEPHQDPADHHHVDHFGLGH